MNTFLNPKETEVHMEASPYANLTAVEVPIYGKIPFRQTYSAYDRNVAYLDTLEGLRVAVNITENGQHYAMEPEKYDYKNIRSRILEPYYYNGHIFRYNLTDSIVRMVCPITDEEKAENAEWQQKYGRPLYPVDDMDFTTITSAGLSKENWFNIEIRDEYLYEWISEVMDSIDLNEFKEGE